MASGQPGTRRWLYPECSALKGSRALHGSDRDCQDHHLGTLGRNAAWLGGPWQNHDAVQDVLHRTTHPTQGLAASQLTRLLESAPTSILCKNPLAPSYFAFRISHFAGSRKDSHSCLHAVKLEHGKHDADLQCSTPSPQCAVWPVGHARLETRVIIASQYLLWSG
jgi:hypothetical protein